MKHIKWDEIHAERLNDKFVRKLAWDGKIMVGLTLVEQGYVVPLHSHDNQQITFVTSGKWRFTIGGKVTDVGPNEMISIPANMPHTAEAVETLVAYDIFTPRGRTGSPARIPTCEAHQNRNGEQVARIRPD